MGEENFFFHFLSSYIYETTLVVIIFQAPSVFVLGTLSKMGYCTQHVLPFNTTVYYRDPGKRKVIIADCVITTNPIAFIFTPYCLFLMFYRFM